MIINENILAILRTSSNQQKDFMKHFTPRRQLFKAAATEFVTKILNRKKISNEQFNLCEAKISLDIIKSINS